MSGSPVVFLGPTLRRADALSCLPTARYLPPARQGDVFRAVRTHAPDRIVLIDGAFLDVPSVWHREVLWALNRGVAVVGAASMGALRAAELAPFGMCGMGGVFAAYRDGVLPGWDEPFEDDDEVAVIHAPGELGWAPLSDAMVDLRATLARAERDGVVGRATRDRLAASVKRRHFPERTFAGLVAAAREAGEAGLAEWLPAHHRSLKAEDARLALRGAGEAARAAPFRRERALVWERFVAAEDRSAALATPQAQARLERLRGDPVAWRSVLLQATGRIAALASVPAKPADAAALDRFRTERGLWTRAALDAWMAASGADAACLARLLGEEASLHAVLAEPSATVRQAMLDILRLCGDDAVVETYAEAARGPRDQVPPLSAVE